MELVAAIRSRRMVRRFAPEPAVPLTVVEDLVALAIRAPSAGFSQGWDFVALLTPAQRDRFWKAATACSDSPDPWLAGVRAAPAVLLCLANPTAYLDRYAEPDKGWSDRSLEHWPIPYWDTDTAMAAMLILLGAQDLGLGALFFGVPAACHDSVRSALAIPTDSRIVGVIALGHEERRVRSPSLRRGRRGVGEVLHVGSFGASAGTSTTASGEDGVIRPPAST